MIWSRTMVKTTAVCYKSNSWELDCLTDTKPTTVIKKLKVHLGTGSPDSLSLTKVLSLFPVSIGTSPRPGVLSTPPRHLIRAKLNQL